MAITVEQALDLTAATLAELGRGRIVDLSYDLQEYVAANKLLNVPEKSRIYDSGDKIQFNALMNKGNNAAMSGLYDNDNLDQVEGLQNGEVPWRFIKNGFKIDRREPRMNRGEAEIVDFVKTKRHQAMVDQVALLEDQFWSKPTSSSNTTDLFGVDYWIVYNATNGHSGGDPSGFTSGAAGLATATYTNWKSYNYTYTNVTQDDLVAGMRTATRKCSFTNPVRIGGMATYDGDEIRRMFYCGESTLQSIEDLARSQNDSLGRELAMYQDMVLIANVPFQYVPKLDSITTALPIYGIDWRSLYWVQMRGEWMRQTGPQEAAGAHNVVETFYDTQGNITCVNRRKQMLFAKSDPTSG